MILNKETKKVLQKNRVNSDSDILYMRKLVRIGSNVRIPEDSHYKNKKYCSCFSKKIEMRKVTMPNFCINFLNKAEKSLPILYDFAVAPLTGAWIKTYWIMHLSIICLSHPSRVRGLKPFGGPGTVKTDFCRIPRGCVD